MGLLSKWNDFSRLYSSTQILILPCKGVYNKYIHVFFKWGPLSSHATVVKLLSWVNISRHDYMLIIELFLKPHLCSSINSDLSVSLILQNWCLKRISQLDFCFSPHCSPFCAGISGCCGSERSHTPAQSGPSQPGLVWPGRPRWSYYHHYHLYPESTWRKYHAIK